MKKCGNCYFWKRTKFFSKSGECTIRHINNKVYYYGENNSCEYFAEDLNCFIFVKIKDLIRVCCSIIKERMNIV